MNHRWLITGAGGMVGTDIRNELEARGADVVALTKNDLDITDAAAVQAMIRKARPDVIVNAAAYTKVDDAERNEHLANAINGSAVEFLAAAADVAGALLIHISSDFVFSGESTTPYQVNDRTAPLSAYGRSKETLTARAVPATVVDPLEFQS